MRTLISIWLSKKEYKHQFYFWYNNIILYTIDHLCFLYKCAYMESRHILHIQLELRWHCVSLCISVISFFCWSRNLNWKLNAQMLKTEIHCLHRISNNKTQKREKKMIKNKNNANGDYEWVTINTGFKSDFNIDNDSANSIAMCK